MLPEEKRNTNVGVGLGILLNCAVAFLPPGTFAPSIAHGIFLLACGLFVWGCVNYARGKGYSGFLGLLGLIPVLGLIVLVLLRDQDGAPPRSKYAVLDRVVFVIALGCVGLLCWNFFHPNRPAISPEAQQRAMKSFPQLGIANSPLNREFLRRYQTYQKADPDFFHNPNWPVILARESQDALRSSAKKSAGVEWR